MGSIALWTLGIRICKLWTTSSSRHQRSLYQSSITPLVHTPALDLPWAQPGLNASALDVRSLATRRKWEDLMDSLSRDRANPSRVWNIYLELCSVMSFEAVPLEIQQQVLRKCVPRTAQLRIAAARRIQAGNYPRVPHVYESRLQTLIQHMRASGRKPYLDDYNFILEQFAAVGHQTGAHLVFEELVHLGVEPSYRTYGLCLQAIAHRLTLPCPFRFRSNMLAEASKMCADLLDDMWTRRIPLTSVNFDLVHRVFKETNDRTTFDRLLKVGYGIDLAHPDQPPLEVQGPTILAGAEDAVQAEALSFKPLPFSTAALNTLIDMLGRTKQISKMITAFEVLTNPIPTPVSKPLTEEGYTDDDDDVPAFYQFFSTASQHQPPSAVPNTTSFNLLIRYAAKANHAVFARHYVVQAIERDRAVDTRLRLDLSLKALKDISSPNFAVNRGTFLPSFGLANRTRHFAFLRWSARQAHLAWNQKKTDLAFYTEWRKNHVVPPTPIPSDGDIVMHADENLLPGSEAPETIDASAHSSSTTFPPSPLSSPPHHSAPRVPAMPKLSEALQVDLDGLPPPPPPQKPLDLNLHISLLQRDVEEIGALVRHTRAAVQRLSQRVKERLGRRIWQGKNIFLMTHNARVHVDKKEWHQLVKFRHPSANQAWRPPTASPLGGDTRQTLIRRRRPPSKS